jgi:hypothetical protein
MGRPALAAALVALVCAATATGSSPAYVSNCGTLVQHPKSVTIACGDGNYSLAKLAWMHWGDASATATGVADVNDCKPYCAAGHFHTFAVRVAATKLTKCGSRRIYLGLTIDYPSTKPTGHPKHEEWPVTCAQALR